MLYAVVPLNQLSGIASTYAGYNINGNSPYNVGMSPNARSNSYYYPDYAQGWTYAPYDLPGSYNAEVVDPYDAINGYSGVGAGMLAIM
eukprot:CAMPEP_0184292252 /NCGR_PEP_ID=MMETSP1049-20130417/4073_1 /TAXON_ID=77928 /ORGANISM="Proteomonas sulcata, Strain CCMP704" /LENGTH=87 /DNA_ID=CAMNT_0026599967 /DNA_START=428 /DNA_END=691 /DNA_ORIENTATION=-